MISVLGFWASLLVFVNNHPVIHKHEKTYDELFFPETITPHSSFELIYPVKTLLNNPLKNAHQCDCEAEGDSVASVTGGEDTSDKQMEPCAGPDHVLHDC